MKIINDWGNGDFHLPANSLYESDGTFRNPARREGADLGSLYNWYKVPIKP
jgi:hypothetical protein